MRRGGLALVVAATLAGCIPSPDPFSTLAGTGARAVLLAQEERGVDAVVDDNTTLLETTHALTATKDPRLHHVEITVYDNRLLMTGRVPDAGQAARARRLVREAAPGYRIIDAMRVVPPGQGDDLETLTHDVAITQEINMRLLFDADISSIDYRITTDAGIVHVLGVANSDEELARVLDHVRDIAHVRGVETHVRRADAPAPRARPPAATGPVPLLTDPGPGPVSPAPSAAPIPATPPPGAPVPLLTPPL